MANYHHPQSQPGPYPLYSNHRYTQPAPPPDFQPPFPPPSQHRPIYSPVNRTPVYDVRPNTNSIYSQTHPQFANQQFQGQQQFQTQQQFQGQQQFHGQRQFQGQQQFHNQRQFQGQQQFHSQRQFQSQPPTAFQAQPLIKHPLQNPSHPLPTTEPFINPKQPAAYRPPINLSMREQLSRLSQESTQTKQPTLEQVPQKQFNKYFSQNSRPNPVNINPFVKKDTAADPEKKAHFQDDYEQNYVAYKSEDDHWDRMAAYEDYNVVDQELLEHKNDYAYIVKNPKRHPVNTGPKLAKFARSTIAEMAYAQQKQTNKEDLQDSERIAEQLHKQKDPRDIVDQPNNSVPVPLVVNETIKDVLKQVSSPPQDTEKEKEPVVVPPLKPLSKQLEEKQNLLKNINVVPILLTPTLPTVPSRNKWAQPAIQIEVIDEKQQTETKEPVEEKQANDRKESPQNAFSSDTNQDNNKEGAEKAETTDLKNESLVKNETAEEPTGSNQQPVPITHNEIKAPTDVTHENQCQEKSKDEVCTRPIEDDIDDNHEEVKCIFMQPTPSKRRAISSTSTVKFTTDAGNLHAYTVVQLKKMCKEKSLSTSGTKQELVDRLVSEKD